MKEEKKKVCPSSIEGANVENVKVDVTDTTTTKGKISSKFTIVDDSEVLDSFESPDKNKVFQSVNDYLCPVKFDDTKLVESLQPLVSSGILSEEAKNAAIMKAKREFLDANSKVIESAQNMTFAEVIDKLKENKVLFNQVLSVCAVSDFIEDRYINGKEVLIYRANQCYDKEGNERYAKEVLSKTINGKTFDSEVFVEKREITTDNIVLSIRYYSAKQNALKRLNNKVSDYKRLLENVLTSAAKAIDNGFSKQQIIDAINAL